AGGAYVPLDPEYPADRLSYMAADSGVSVVVATARTAADVPPGLRMLLLDEAAEAVRLESTEPLQRPIGDGQLAYVIYTSGSTGRPKGVA
ncbi:hypothetical protein ADK38_46725, partial [Streptomyces varsoviensis]